jgi:hypothetical protein
MNPEYYKNLALEAIDALADKYPGSSKPSVIRSMVHTLSDDVLKTCLLDKRLHKTFIEFIVDELAARHPEEGEALIEETLNA